MAKLQSRSLKKAKGTAKPKRDVEKSAPKSSWKTKMQRKEELDRVKALSRSIRDELKDEQDRARASRRANRQRKAENEKNNMVVQEIKNNRAISKLSPKQRRKARIYLKHEL